MSEKLMIEFIINKKTHTVGYESGDSILDTAIRHDVNPPYSCMEGVCSACLAQVQMGEVDYPDDTSLDEGDVKKGLILTCQAKPAMGTTKLVINYDAV
jgi:ring-1,2-phenylacetyl-CoA epoxidase subunit PaaE